MFSHILCSISSIKGSKRFKKILLGLNLNKATVKCNNQILLNAITKTKTFI